METGSEWVKGKTVLWDLPRSFVKAPSLLWLAFLLWLWVLPSSVSLLVIHHLHKMQSLNIFDSLFRREGFSLALHFNCFFINFYYLVSDKHLCTVTIGIMLAYLPGLFCSMENTRRSRNIARYNILIPALLFIPESPRWLAKMGMTDDFESSLQVLRGFDTDISIEVNEIKRAVASSTRRTTIRMAELKQKKYYLPLTIGIGLLIFQQLSGANAVVFYSSSIFESAGITSSNVATLGIGAIQVIATAVATWLADKAGRRLLLIISSIGMTVSLLIVAASFYAKDFISEDSGIYSVLGIFSVVGVVAMIIFFSLGMGPIPWVIMSEIFPINIKGLAGSVATLFNWLSAWVVTMSANLLLTWSPGGTFTIYMILSAVAVAFVSFLVPETKGKGLEEIQRSFR
ncbi:sugar transporter ERD6-like 6 isoform X2 [Mangifera indica]|uniref:sugar transporter ERD6-like 6 isoform X2 n=1 Tax=Mangifera indica TaxID=29780 RepID=UPI001CFB31F7|nr:sugar transporter ERD6-like 6 isoform X2 [Mangifera indica]